MQVQHQPAAPPLDLRAIVAKQKLTGSEKQTLATADASFAEIDALDKTTRDGGLAAAAAQFDSDPSAEAYSAVVTAYIGREVASQVRSRFAVPTISRLHREVNGTIEPIATRILDTVESDLREEAAKLKAKLSSATGLGVNAGDAQLDQRLAATLAILAEARQRAADGHAREVVYEFCDDSAAPKVTDLDLDG